MIDLDVLLCVILSSFFFFKQKTAYEMRISDWSSDVCSSDLARSDRLPGLEIGIDDQPEHVARARGQFGDRGRGHAMDLGTRSGGGKLCSGQAPRAPLSARPHSHRRKQIGRAHV